jgi:hypothetical protein
MCSFNTNDKRSHGSIPAITPHFFFFFSFENNTHQPKGTSSKEVKIRALESKIICSFLQFFPRADLDSRQLLFARLRKIGIPLPSAATWRMHLKL